MEAEAVYKLPVRSFPMPLKTQTGLNITCCLMN